ncbi:MAG: sigma-70 family RNA polymerase sigma factor [Bacteroidota bacterium]|nr:sigma-70 family RNA polymerase sigma factor [Bacteroidota bacterium]
MRHELSKKERDEMFEQEFLPHLNSLYNFAIFLRNDEEEAKDLLQETYLRAYRFINYYEKGTNAKAWLIRILKNTFINEYRKKSKAPTRVNFEDTFQQADDTSDDVQNVDLRQEIYNNIVGDEIMNAVNSLPVDYRLIILLCDVEGFKYDEIARIIDVPIGTVRSRLHRARNMLKEKLKDYAEKRGYQV